MKQFIAAMIILASSGAADASCYGTGTYRTCTDDSGNQYTVTRHGDTTRVQGFNYNTGSQWSQSTRQSGDSAYTTGYDAEGNQWTQQTRRSGNTTYQSGYDSDGNHYNGTIRRSGNSTTYSGTDSDGNFYQKTCNQFGCY